MTKKQVPLSGVDRENEYQRPACILSVDVEDWFHVLGVSSAPEPPEWDRLPSRVERNFLRLLDIFDETGARATCFFLGWIASRYPHLVRRAAAAGHEIASHGYAHRLIGRMTSRQMFGDALRSRKLLEDTSGQPVLGYRAAGFSVTAATPWFFDALLDAGYRYDSSVFPGRRNHGGMPGARFAPYAIVSASGNLVEFPVTVTKACGLPFCFFGGGYLRLAPLPLILRMTRRVLRENRPVIFYVHPREIDVRQPRLAMSPRRRFQTYVNLATTERKLQHLLATFETSSFAEFLGWRAGRSTVTMEAHSPDARTVALAAPATEGATAS
jgi:polysaccharide deacetylase family protein (PEP-CTERM system associated)